MKNAVKRPKDELQRIRPDSTWLNAGIRTLDQLKSWILMKLGAPLLTVELTDEQIECCIHDAISVYSKFAYSPERYLVVNLAYYRPGAGVDLSDFGVMSVKSVSTPRDGYMSQCGDVFFGPYAYFGQGQGFPFFNSGSGNYVGAWTTFHNVNEFFQLSREMCGNNPDFEYDRRTRSLRLMPEPATRSGHILLTCNCEQSPEEYYGNEYVRRLCLAECKILLGTIRKKFGGITMPGGGQIDASIADEGREEK